MSKKKYYLGDGKSDLKGAMHWCTKNKVTCWLTDVSDFSLENDYVLEVIFDEDDTQEEMMFVLGWVNGN
jgi:predicted metal-binding transcription factor (methanogenesis marker protein 9)